MLHLIYSQHRVRRRSAIHFILSNLVSSPQSHFLLRTNLECSFTSLFVIPQWTLHNRKSASNSFDLNQFNNFNYVTMEQARIFLDGLSKDFKQISFSINEEQLRTNIFKIFNSFVGYKKEILDLCESVISIFGLNGQVNFALKVISWMNEKGIKPQLSTYHALLEVFAMNRMQKEMHDIIHKISKEFSPNSQTYNILTRGYIKLRQNKLAFNAAETLNRSSELKAGDYAVIIDAFGRFAGSTAAEQKFKEMKEKGIQPTLETYNALLTSYAINKQHNRLSLVVNEMKSIGISPSMKTYTIIIGVVGKLGELRQMEKLYKEATKLCGKPDLIILTNVAFGYAHSGKLDKVLGVFRTMKDLDLKPDGYVYSAILKALKNVDHIDRVFREVKENQTRLSRALYAAVMNAYLDVGHLEKGMEIFQEMKQARFLPAPANYNRLITYLLKRRMISEADEIEKEMEQNGIFPNTEVANQIIIGHHNESVPFSKLVDIKNYFFDEKRKKIIPDLNTYLIMINAALSRDDVAGMSDMLDDLYKKGLKATIDVFNTIMNYFGVKGLLDDMEEVYRDLRANEITPNEDTFYLLFKKFLECNQLSRHSDYLEDMLNFKINMDSVNIILMNKLGYTYQIDRKPPKFWKQKKRII